MANLNFRIILALLLTFCVWNVSNHVSAQCETAYQGGRITGNVSFGDPINWANPNRALVSDDLSAYCSLQPGDTSKYLLIRDVFSATPLPVDAVILGVELLVEKSAEAGAMATDASVKLYVGGAVAGTEHKMPTTWSDKDFTEIYGGLGDTWGLVLTAADVNSANFGAMISSTRTGGPASPMRSRVDWMAVKIFYTSSSTPCTLDGNEVILTATAEGNMTQLEWTSSTGMIAANFEIETSLDGYEFEPITTLNPEAVQSGDLSYTYTLESPQQTEVFLRIRQVDLDGFASHSNLIRIQQADETDAFAHIGPNPFHDQLNLNFVQDFEGDLILMDLNGSVVSRQKISQEGMGQVSLPGITELNAGMYILRLVSGSGTQMVKLIKS